MFSEEEGAGVVDLDVKGMSEKMCTINCSWMERGIKQSGIGDLNPFPAYP